MKLPDLYRALLEVFGIDDPAKAPEIAKRRILDDLNGALQLIANAGEDFYAREAIAVTLEAAMPGYQLPDGVQSVLDPVTLQDGTLLRRLNSRGQVLQFGQLFLDRLDNDVPPGRPQAYFVESLRKEGSDDNVRVLLTLLPAPAAAEVANNLIVNVIQVPGQLTEDDLEDDSKSVPVAHKYIESILLPIVRFNATTSYLFFQTEKRPQFEEEYQRALRLLGLSDPRRGRGDAVAAELEQAPAQQQQAQAA